VLPGSGSSASGVPAAPGALPLTQGAACSRALARDWAVLLGLWLIVTACNLFKPYHIDDTAYLEIVRWIQAHPWHPLQGQLNWAGTLEPIYRLSQPHLYFYLLAVWAGLFGLSEPAMHAAQSLAAALCIVLFYRLCRLQQAGAALWATAMLVLGPAFIVEQNLMVDVPLLAAWLAFFTVLIGGVDDPRQNRRYVLAGVACAVALLIKYSSLVLLAILVVSLVIEHQRRRAWVVLIPLGSLLAWSVFNYFDYGGVHVLTRTQGVHSLKLLITWPVGIGALTPLGWIALAQSGALRRHRHGPLALYLSVAGGLAALALGVALGVVPEALSDRLLWLGFALNALLLCRALAPSLGLLAWLRSPRRVPRAALPGIYVALWLAATSLFYVLFAPFMAARHALLVLPAILLGLLARWGESLPRAARLFGLALTVVVSAGLTLEDWHFAEFYRQEAATLSRTLPPAPRAWASGHWGWQWYAERHGFAELDVRASPLHSGELLLIAREADPQPPLQAVSLERLRTDTEAASWQPFCVGHNGGLYAYRGLLQTPWSFSRACVHHIDILRVN